MAYYFLAYAGLMPDDVCIEWKPVVLGQII